MSAWVDDAFCLGVDPELMQPEAATPDQVAEAMAMCEGCPVMAQCRELAESQVAPETGLSTAYGVHAGEWWGDPPRRPVVACEWCGEDVPNAAKGQQRRYCSPAHQKAARRAALRIAS